MMNSPHTRSNRERRPRRRAFTLVEILIVVVILAILAAMVIPQFSSAAEDSRTNAIQMDLYRIRNQLEVYRNQHADTWPSYAGFVDQMTMHTDINGNTNAVQTPVFKFGPYLRELPINPETGTSDLGNGAPGTSAWYYDETTGAFHANDSALSFTW